MAVLRSVGYRTIILVFCVLSTGYAKAIQEKVDTRADGPEMGADEPHEMVKRDEPPDIEWSQFESNEDYWHSFEEWSEEWDDRMEPYAERGVIIPGFTFTDALNMLGRMNNSRNLRQVLDTFCSDAGRQVHGFLGASGDMVRSVCPAIDADRHDMPIQSVGLSSVCEILVGGIGDRFPTNEGLSESLSGHDLFGSLIDSDWWPSGDISFDYLSQSRPSRPDSWMSDWSYFTWGDISGGSSFEGGNWGSFHSSWPSYNLDTSYFGGHWDRNVFILTGLHNNAIDAIASIFADEQGHSTDLCSFSEGPVQWENTYIANKFREILGKFVENLMYSCAYDCVEYLNSQDGCAGADCERPVVGDDVDAMDYIRVIFTFLGRYDNSKELCSVVVNATGHGRPDSDHDLRAGAIERMVTTFYEILYDAEACVNFIDAFETLPLYLEEITGFDDADELCASVAKTMDSTVAPLDYSDAVFTDDDGDDDNDEVAAPVGLNSVISYLDFNQILGVFGVMKREAMAVDSMKALCRYLEPGFEYMDENIAALCRGVNDNMDDDFNEACTELVYGYNEDTQPYDYYSESATNGGYEEDVLGEMVWDISHAVWYVAVDYESPYKMCAFVSDTMQWDYNRARSLITDILHQFFTNVMMSRLHNCYDLINEEEFNDERVDEVPDDNNNGNNNDDEPDVLDYVKEAFVFIGNFPNAYEMCSTIAGDRDNENPDTLRRNEELREELAIHFTDMLYEILQDASGCEGLVAHLEQQGLHLPIESVTGHDLPTMCQMVASAMDVTVDNVRFDDPIFPTEIPSTSFDVHDHILKPGSFLPYVTFDQFVGIIGEIIREDTGSSAYSVICRRLEPALRLLNISGIDEICRLIGDGDTQAVEDGCINVLVPIYYGKDFPTAIRPFDFDGIVKDLLTVVGYDEDEEICQNIDHIINGDRSPHEIITEAIDIVLQNTWNVLVGMCRSWDDINKFLMFESSSWSSSSSSSSYSWLSSSSSAAASSSPSSSYSLLSSSSSSSASPSSSSSSSASPPSLSSSSPPPFSSSSSSSFFPSILWSSSSSSSLLRQWLPPLQSSPSHNDWQDELDLSNLIQYGDQLIGIITGYGSISSTCDAIVEADDIGDRAVNDIRVRLRDMGLGLARNVDRCTKIVSSIFDAMNEIITNDYSYSSTGSSFPFLPSIIRGSSYDGTDHDQRNFEPTFEYITGFDDHREFCEVLVAAMTQEPVEICRGLVDCLGICNGDARLDCDNVCGGQATADCSGQCNGGAILNECGECVRGMTGLPERFGRDQCGACRRAAGYVKAWDCAGTCNGHAFIDSCGECVAGESGKPPDHNDDRLDCRPEPVCDGGWVEDSCGFCEPPLRAGVAYAGGSKYKDCSLTCFQPGMVGRADVNQCGVCVGGETGLSEDHGRNVCGQCDNDGSADTMSCVGCDGVANSGKEYDVCGVCDGNGDCIGIGNISPNFIPANQDVKLRVVGAGFTIGSSLACIFTSTQGQSINGEVTEHISMTALTCTANLNAGRYIVHIRRNGELHSDYFVYLEVYADVIIESITPSLVVIDPEVEQEFDIVATLQSGSNFNAIRAIEAPRYDVIPSILIEHPVYTHINRWKSVFASGTEITVTVPVPSFSGRFEISASVNYQHMLATVSGDKMILEIYHQAPQLERIRFSPNGAGLIITFSSEVHYEEFESCADIFENADDLGAGAKCTWLSPKILLALFGKGDGLLGIGDSLTLKSGAVRAFRQELSYAAEGSAVVEALETTLELKAILSGSEQIPSCGDIRMDGRKSVGSGARPLMFLWSVTSSSGSTTNIQEELDTLNAMDNGYGSSVLYTSGSHIDTDTAYEFTMTVTNFLGHSDSASLTVHRSTALVPEVKISAEGIDVDGVKISKSFKLTVDVVYSECVPPGKTVFRWSTSNTDVALNPTTKDTRSLYVPSGSLPGGEEIEFTVEVYKSSNPDASISTSIPIVTVKSELEAVIKGSEKFTVGRVSGTVRLDGSVSVDPDNEARAWTYEWQCLQIDDNSACWSFDPGHTGSLISDSSNSNAAIMEFNALALQADKTYKFTLRVSKAERSATADVYVSAVNGDPPQVDIQPIGKGGVVKDDENIYVTAYIHHSVSIDIANATWAFNTDLGYGFIDLNDNTNLLISPQLIGDYGITTLFFVIKKGVVERGTEYSLSVTVYQVDGQRNLAEVTFGVLAGPTSCDFRIADYQELTEVEVCTENCVTQGDAYPLSYQLFVDNDKENLEAITEMMSEPTFNIIGKPRIEGSDARDYKIRVYDTNGMYSTYSASPTVTPTESFSEEEKSDFKEQYIQPKIYKGQYIDALGDTQVMLSFQSAVATNRRRRRRNIIDTSTEDVTDQLELISSAIDSSVLTTSSANVLLDQTVYVSIAEMSLSDQNDYISYIDTIVQVFIDADTIVPTGSSESTLEKLAEIRANLDPTYNANMLASIASLQDKLMSSQAKGLVLGEVPQVTSMSDVTSSVAKTLLDGTFTTSTASGAAAVTIDFGSQLQNTYGGAWSCGSSTCSGVTITLLHYADSVDYRSVTDDDKNARASSIISVQLSNPDSGDEIDVSDLTDPITMTIPLTNPQSGVTYECRYWDTDHSAWSVVSMTTALTALTSDVECQSNHLTDFAVFAVPIEVVNVDYVGLDTTNAPIEQPEDEKNVFFLYILICLAVAVLLIVVLIVVICILKKKSNTKSEATTQHQSPAQQPVSLAQQQPQVQTVLQPIIIQQPYPVRVPPASNYANPTIYPSAPAYDAMHCETLSASQPAVTLVMPNGELQTSSLSDQPATTGDKKHSASYCSYVEACTGGMVPVMEPSYPPYMPPPTGANGSGGHGSGSSSPNYTGHC